MNLADGDTFFKGLNMDLDPAILAQGLYSRGEHVELENGVIGSRRGNLVVPWADTWAYTRTYEGRPVTSHGTIFDAIRFSNPVSGDESIVFATAAGGYVVKPGNLCKLLAWPNAYPLQNGGRLVQAFDEVFWLSEAGCLRWSGDAQVSWEYLYLDPGDLGGGFLGFPKTDRGAYFNNRLFLKQDGNTVIASDILAPERFSVLNEFYVNQGDADEIVALVPYVGYRLIVFKNNSIYSIDNLTGDLSDAAINLVGVGVGAVSDRSIQVVGQQVFWLGRNGVYRASIAYENRLTPDFVPVSKDIDPIIRRINWGSAHKSVSLVNGDRYYIAVPLDDATSNNAVLVYNMRYSTWESIDTYTEFTKECLELQLGANKETWSDSFGPQALVNLDVAGREKMFGFTKAGCLFLHRYNTGKADIAIEHTDDFEYWLDNADGQIGTDTYNRLIIHQIPFDSVIETRGYLANNISTKLGGHVELTVSTMDPDVDVELVTTGPNEVWEVKEGITRSRSKRLDFANSSTGTVPQVHSEAFLEDYSLQLYSTVNDQTTSGYVDFFFGAGQYADVEVGREQEFQERFRLVKRFRAPRVRLTNAKGILRLKSVLIKQIQRFNAHRREV